MAKVKSLQEQSELIAAKNDWDQARQDKRKHKAMRQKRQNGRGRAWQLAV